MVAGRHTAVLTEAQRAWVARLLPIADQEAAVFRRPRQITREEMRAAAYLGLCNAARHQDRPGTTLARLCCRQAIMRDIRRSFFRVGSKRRFGVWVNSIDSADNHIDDNPLDTLIAREELERLRLAISRLTPTQRRYVEGRLRGLKIDQFGVDQQSASDGYQRGLRALRAALA